MSGTKRISVVVAACLLVLGFPGTSLAREVVKATTADRWNPDFVHVSWGEKVIWKNPAWQGREHTVTAYGRNWSKDVFLDPGERTSKVFRKRGTYKYRCTLHSNLSNGNCSGMCGVVHRAPL